MAQMNKCSACENFNFKNAKCSIYNKDIPNDIFLELQVCEHYKAEEQKSENDLPVAKGR